MDKIKIKGYKSIKELEMTLRPINILIGANGSGKSNFLSFFDFLKQIYNRNLQEFVALKGVDTFLHKGVKITQEISTHLYFENNDYFLRIKKGDTGFIFTEERLGYINNPSPVNIASYGNESNLREEDGPRAFFIKTYVNQLKKYHFHDTGENSPFSKESHIKNDRFILYKKGDNLASFLYNIQKEHATTYNLIIKTIQSVAPYFLDFFWMPEPSDNIELMWQSKYFEPVFGVNTLSDGTIRFIALATLLLQPSLPETIIIDEPELGLHPTAIAKLAGLIKSASKKGCQIIIATQSTDLISHFDPEDIITVDQINGESKFERLSSDTLAQWLEDYTIDDLWKRNIISTGQPNFN